jgi:hypothetical protein
MSAPTRPLAASPATSSTLGATVPTAATSVPGRRDCRAWRMIAGMPRPSLALMAIVTSGLAARTLVSATRKSAWVNGNFSSATFS